MYAYHNDTNGTTVLIRTRYPILESLAWILTFVFVLSLIVLALLGIAILTGTLHAETRAYVTGDVWHCIMWNDTDLSCTMIQDNYLMQAYNTVSYHVGQFAQWVNENIMRTQ